MFTHNDVVCIETLIVFGINCPKVTSRQFQGLCAAQEYISSEVSFEERNIEPEEKMAMYRNVTRMLHNPAYGQKVMTDNVFKLLSKLYS